MREYALGGIQPHKTDLYQARGQPETVVEQLEIHPPSPKTSALPSPVTRLTT